jgi:hypothetical protein
MNYIYNIKTSKSSLTLFFSLLLIIFLIPDLALAAGPSGAIGSKLKPIMAEGISLFQIIVNVGLSVYFAYHLWGSFTDGKIRSYDFLRGIIILVVANALPQLITFIVTTAGGKN